MGNSYIKKEDGILKKLPITLMGKKYQHPSKKPLWIDEKSIRAFPFLHFLTLNSLFYLL